MKFRRLGIGLVAAASFSFGCSFVDSAINKASSSAGDKVGQSVGSHVGDSMVAGMSPMMMQYYVGALMTYAFHSGGYDVNEAPYTKGQYTTWNLPASEDASVTNTMTRAYLGDDADGNHWWKVKFTDTKQNQVTILEALFDKDQTKVLRMRAKFPNDKEGKEMPVQENTYYVPPTKLTKQSLKGATKGYEQVSVPAGSFKAQHVVFGNAAGGTSEWFLNDKVPGGAVKFVQSYEAAQQSDEQKADGEKEMNSKQYQLLLAAYGNDATSELGSMDAPAAQ
jgi:hypothetical protein